MEILEDIRIKLKFDKEQDTLTIECDRNGLPVYLERMDTSIFAKIDACENPIHEVIDFLNPHSFETKERRDGNRDVKKHFNSLGVWVLKLFGKYKKLTI